jgi:holin (3TMs family)
MFEFIVGKLLATPVIGAILGPIVNAVITIQKQKLDALGAHEAQVERVALQAQLNDQREAAVNAEVVKAEQGNWVTRSVRPMLALPVIILVWKLLVWDKALGQWTHGSTDSLSDQIWWYCTTVTIAYMGGRSFETVATRIAGIFKKD